MKKISFIISSLVLSVSTLAQNLNQDSTFVGQLAAGSNQLKVQNHGQTTTSPSTYVNLTPLKGVCKPGPDGWIHTYGDKGGCFDDLHIQCSYDSNTKQYYIVQAVYGCFTSW